MTPLIFYAIIILYFFAYFSMPEYPEENANYIEGPEQPPEAGVMALFLMGEDVGIWNELRRKFPSLVLDYREAQFNLRNKKIPGADLHGVQFGIVDLRDTDLSYADLTDLDLSQACIDPETTLFTGAKIDGVVWPPNEPETLQRLLERKRQGELEYEMSPEVFRNHMFCLLLTGKVAEWNRERQVHPQGLLNFSDLEANLQGKSLAGIDLSGVVCGNFDFRNCDLSNADLRGADLARVCLNLDTTKFDGIQDDEVTAWPFSQKELVTMLKRKKSKQ